MAIDVRWREGERLVRWSWGDVAVEMTFPAPPASVTAWADPPSVIVVERADRLDNAVVFEPDGTERLRLRPPAVSPERHWDVGFYVVYAGSDGLVAVFSTRVGDFWGRPDLLTGELSSVAQWR
ncbi:hypothetical protein [Asanoa sp. NPDC050611]|uniref:hypothetical protein n=1 Tax=Asanoa sp. NPDC050611 TaxID=3157098 RepID=UPI0033F2C1F5